MDMHSNPGSGATSSRGNRWQSTVGDAPGYPPSVLVCPHNSSMTCLVTISHILNQDSVPRRRDANACRSTGPDCTRQVGMGALNGVHAGQFVQTDAAFALPGPLRRLDREPHTSRPCPGHAVHGKHLPATTERGSQRQAEMPPLNNIFRMLTIVFQFRLNALSGAFWPHNTFSYCPLPVFLTREATLISLLS
jgi:hypothetical protein